MSNRNLTLMTDLYQLTMMQGYFKANNKNEAVFDAFYRTNPCQGGYAIFAGLEQVIDYIKNLQFTDGDIEYLREKNVYTEEFLEYLNNLRFDIKTVKLISSSTLRSRNNLFCLTV